MTLSLSATRALSRRTGNTRSRLSLLAVLAVWKERRELAQMDIGRLKDMGISPRDAAAEAARSFWDLPARTCR